MAADVFESKGVGGRGIFFLPIVFSCAGKGWCRFGSVVEGSIKLR